MKRTILLCVLLLMGGATVCAQPAPDQFYRGKTINIYVGFPPGGGYDIYARMVAMFLGRHVPGNPTVIVHNMEGGVGVRAAAYLANATPQDGTSLGVFLDGLTLTKVLGGPGSFDPVKFNWIGRIVSTATFAMVWHTASAQTVEQAKIHEITVGATSVSSSSSYIPLALNDLDGTEFKVIRGYTGSAPIALAMERGEINAHGGMALETILANKQDWLTEQKAKFLYYLGAHRYPEKSEVPALLDFATDDRSRSILSLLGSPVDIGRSFAAEPGAPSDRVTALREAFMQTTRDPEFVAAMKDRNLLIEPVEGRELQNMVIAVTRIPSDRISQAKRYLSP